MEKKEPSVTVQRCHIANLRLVKMAGWFNCKNLANQLTCSHKRPAAMHTEETCPTGSGRGNRLQTAEVLICTKSSRVKTKATSDVFLAV